MASGPTHGKNDHSNGLVSLLGFSVVMLAGALPAGSAAQLTADMSEQGGSRLRDVRVLIGSGVDRFRMRFDGPLSVQDTEGARIVTTPERKKDNVIDVRSGTNGRILIGEESWNVSSVLIETPRRDTPIGVSFLRGSKWSIERMYAGSLRVERRADGRFDVINLVNVERYVSCVVANEVWPSFHEETYRAQAVLARSYVLYHMTRRSSPRYDVSATEGSQVYRGIRTDGVGRRAEEATRYTRGLVMTWIDDGVERLFCTYYSSVCGGVSQSAAVFGKYSDIAPLAGGVRCDYCAIAPGDSYRWGPVKLSGGEIARRLADRYQNRFAQGQVRRIDIIERDESRRPTRIRIVDAEDAAHDMLAERFRLAIGADDLRSTFFSVRNSSRSITFEDGRGFGHGLGACQWGMEGQARNGRRAGEMLRYYYPGASVTRAY